jgi:hypothetical protein
MNYLVEQEIVCRAQEESCSLAERSGSMYPRQLSNLNHFHGVGGTLEKGVSCEA